MRNPFKKKPSIAPDVEEYGPLSRKEERVKVPPGQHVAKRWPVLSIENTPNFDGKNWDVIVEGLVENPVTWKWDEFQQLPHTELKCDLHCVTTWSLLDQTFSGVLFKDILDIVKPLPEARYVTFEAFSGYTSALPLEEGYLLEDDVLLTDTHAGQPLDPDHGGPLRLIVPQLYLWKSVKWVRKIIFTSEWERGYWEDRGYHQRGDPWLVERYSSQERVTRRR